MSITEMLLDPDAQSYTADEIVGKVNDATDKITRADSVEIVSILESATELLMSDTEQAKLAGIDAGAEVNPADTDDLAEGATNKYDTGTPPANLEELPDGVTRKAMLDAEKSKLTGIEAGADVNPTGIEIDGLVVAVAPADRKIIVSDPAAGEHRVAAIQRASDGKLSVDYESVVE